jgi:O-methyltransferase involved in polyketide biosynthesis
MEPATGDDAHTGDPAACPGPDDQATLRDLRNEFPHFAIWREDMPDGTRYNATRVAPGSGLHSLITADLGEMRAILTEARCEQHPAPAPLPAGEAVPNIARMYSYFLGGRDHQPTDRLAAESLTAHHSEVTEIARANRALVLRAVTHVATLGITQFIDLGAGLPAPPTVHHTARTINPAARTAYVDNDPLVLARARAKLATTSGVAVVDADLRDPEVLLASPGLRSVIDLTRPVCVLAASVLHFLPPGDADALVETVTALMVPGGYLALSVGTGTGTDPDLISRLRSAYAGTTIVSARTEDEIMDWFTGLELLRPGLVDVRDWRPGHAVLRSRWGPRPAARFLAALARKSVPIM